MMGIKNQYSGASCYSINNKKHAKIVGPTLENGSYRSIIINLLMIKSNLA